MTTTEKHIGTVMQHTLNESISYVGRGLHTGHKVAMRLRPGEVNSGICFVTTRWRPTPSSGVWDACHRSR